MTRQTEDLIKQLILDQNTRARFEADRETFLADMNLEAHTRQSLMTLDLEALESCIAGAGEVAADAYGSENATKRDAASRGILNPEHRASRGILNPEHRASRGILNPEHRARGILERQGTGLPDSSGKLKKAQ